MHRETVNGHPWLSEDNGNGLVLIDLAGKIETTVYKIIQTL